MINALLYCFDKSKEGSQELTQWSVTPLHCCTCLSSLMSILYFNDCVEALNKYSYFYYFFIKKLSGLMRKCTVNEVNQLRVSRLLIVK